MDKTDNTIKLPYEPPTFVAQGSLRDMTLGSKVGQSLDKNFPPGTPFTQLTFS